MTPVPGIAAVEAVAGRQPLATLQALAEAVMRDASPTPSAPGSAMDTVRLQAPAETQASQRPLEHLLQPAQLSALHAPATDPARPRQLPAGQDRRGAGSGPGAAPDADRDSHQDHQPEDEGHGRPRADAPAEDEATGQAAPRPSAAGGRGAGGAFGDAGSADAASLAALLRTHGPADAVADLARGRRVLLVLPAGDATGPWRPARAWLLDARRATCFAARWWSAAPDHGWPAWRLFRDGDPLLARGLASLAAPGVGCRLRLGSSAALRLAASAPAIATLAIHDRQRFADDLGGQWSVVLTVAPPGSWTP